MLQISAMGGGFRWIARTMQGLDRSVFFSCLRCFSRYFRGILVSGVLRLFVSFLGFDGFDIFFRLFKKVWGHINQQTTPHNPQNTWLCIKPTNLQSLSNLPSNLTVKLSKAKGLSEDIPSATPNLHQPTPSFAKGAGESMIQGETLLRGLLQRLIDDLHHRSLLSQLRREPPHTAGGLANILNQEPFYQNKWIKTYKYYEINRNNQKYIGTLSCRRNDFSKFFFFILAKHLSHPFTNLGL